MISIIVAVANNGVIGKAGGLPWYLPAELANFKKITFGHPIAMGRNTHESIGRALPGRANIVITHNPSYQAEGCIIVQSLPEALEAAKKTEGAKEVFVIGGESVFAEALPLADRIYLTKVKADVEGDRFFKFNSRGWRQTVTEKHPADADNKYAYEFTILEKET